MSRLRKYKTTSDSFLWKELCRGNESVFQQVYENYIQVLYDYGLRLTQKEDVIKDSIQEIFIDIYRNRKSLGDTNNIKLYLFKSLKRKIIKILSKNKFLFFEDIPEILFLSEYSVEEEIILSEKEKEKLERLQKAINNLPPRQKEAIYLRFVEGMEYEEICSILDMNYQSVRNLVSRALSKLRIVIREPLLILLPLVFVSQ